MSESGYVSREWTAQVDAALGELAGRLEAVLVLVAEVRTEAAAHGRRLEALEGALALLDARVTALEATRRRRGRREEREEGGR
jgi:hypothetical protein